MKSQNPFNPAWTTDSMITANMSRTPISNSSMHCLSAINQQQPPGSNQLLTLSTAYEIPIYCLWQWLIPELHLPKKLSVKSAVCSLQTLYGQASSPFLLEGVTSSLSTFRHRSLGETTLQQCPSNLNISAKASKAKINSSEWPEHLGWTRGR
jgi:hypothetical protein